MSPKVKWIFLRKVLELQYIKGYAIVTGFSEICNPPENRVKLTKMDKIFTQKITVRKNESNLLLFMQNVQQHD